MGSPFVLLVPELFVCLWVTPGSTQGLLPAVPLGITLGGFVEPYGMPEICCDSGIALRNHSRVKGNVWEARFLPTVLLLQPRISRVLIVVPSLLQIQVIMLYIFNAKKTLKKDLLCGGSLYSTGGGSVMVKEAKTWRSWF